MATARKRVHPSIDKKVEVIKYAADDPGVGVRAIGEQFKVSKIKVSDILLKNKKSIQTSLESYLATHQKPCNSKLQNKLCSICHEVRPTHISVSEEPYVCTRCKRDKERLNCILQRMICILAVHHRIPHRWKTC